MTAPERGPHSEIKKFTKVANARLLEAFRDPPLKYGPTPFWWWVGDRLYKDRIAWQLDQLRSKGIWNTIVSYSHQNDGHTSVGDPPIYSDAWWELFEWTVKQCKSRGMQISIQDYTIINPILQDIGRTTPDMQGGQLRQCSLRVTRGQQCVLKADRDCAVISCTALRTDVQSIPDGNILDLADFTHGGTLEWNPPEGDWLVTLVMLEPRAFDPMHPAAGARLIDRLYAPFEQRFPEELGKTIPLFFQDELDFGAKMPLWSDRLLTEFLLRKGYDLKPLLPAIWHDIGPITPKVRIDYSDVVTTLMEENYFIPIFRWHESHGTMLANDNIGRGSMEQGRLHYGDYFRAMRWYSAPGTDDPNVNGPRAFAGLKVNSSIAHLYGRDRVWNECFHSSGWGATPAQIVAAINQNFLYGATVINLHGLYYSTHGSWWEWAPPDFHFRQPYWEHSERLNLYISRLCWLLSQGNHICDVAIVYPITAIEGGLNAHVKPSEGYNTDSISEQQRGVFTHAVDAAEAHAFGAGKHLFDQGIDFDFVDFQSIERAVVEGDNLCMAGERYRVLILPMMSSVRFSTLLKAHEFFRAGGQVIATGCLPLASDHAGMNDPELTKLVREIFGNSGSDGTATCNVGDSGGRGIFIPGDYARIKGIIDQNIVRDFVPHDAPLQTLHRRIGQQDVYMVFNPQDQPVESEASFRCLGRVQRWDAMNGEALDVAPRAITDDSTRVPLNIGAHEAQLIVFSPPSDTGTGDCVAANTNTEVKEIVDMAGLWNFSLVPTMDNRFGDFRLPIDSPSGDHFIGAEARRFRYSEETSPNPPWQNPDFDDSSWPLTTFSFGPRFWKLGPIPHGADLEGIETQLSELHAVSPDTPVMASGRAYFWAPYSFSLRWGIEDDPFLKNWASGPHGLKMEVPDDFIDLYCDDPGATWYLFSSVLSSQERQCMFQMGSRSPYLAWINGRRVLEQTTALPPGYHPPWHIPHYQSDPRQSPAVLTKGDNALLLRLTQSPGQRVRAYAVFDPQPRTNQLAMRWFTSASVPHFNYRPGDRFHVGWYRFWSPPGLAALTAVVKGIAEIWVNGVKCSLVSLEKGDQACASIHVYRADIAKPSPHPVVVAIRVQQALGSYAGDALPEPVMMRCVSGELPLGDWSQFGLATYSGIVKYRRIIRLMDQQASKRIILDMGELSASATVCVNGVKAGTLICPPWRIDISRLVRTGDNMVEISVANTLANHYSVGIPTPYVLPGQTVSGLLGPVRLIIYDGPSRHTMKTAESSVQGAS